MSSMPDGVEGTIRRFGGRAKHCHGNEPSGKGVGMPIAEGDAPSLDFQAVFKALADSGYNRWVSVEPFDYTPDPTTVAGTAIKTLKAARAAAGIK